jgi:DMSO/TMAO reductase YedYZ molybdopterin-dependent catalytic subunit
MITRRGLLEAAGGALGFGGGGALTAPAGGAESTNSGLLWLSPLLPVGTRSEAVLDALPGKKPLIKLTYRPPNYEAPLAYLRTAITPNDEFFVRYHLADIPQIDAGTWKLNLGGEGANGDLQIGLDDLKRLPAFEIAAVCQCAGKGARLKDVLDLVGLKKDAVEIVFDGADGPVLDKTPDFVKSLPVWKAIEETTLVAYEMNGEVLPHWNGFPARIVVPGWTGTFWVKHLTKIAAVSKPFDGFWMKTGYRIPVGKFPLVQRFISQETAVTTPITEIVVNSLITSPIDGARVKAGRKAAISGIAWDGGYGISAIEVAADGGKSWTQAALGEDFGKFAFRPWSYDFTPKARGKLSLTARATNKIGQTQTQELIQNPAGYCNNAAQTVTLDVA